MGESHTTRPMTQFPVVFPHIPYMDNSKNKERSAATITCIVCKWENYCVLAKFHLVERRLYIKAVRNCESEKVQRLLLETMLKKRTQEAIE